MRVITALLGLLSALALVGCAPKEPPGPTPEQIAQQKVQQAMAAGAARDQAPLEAVAVAEQGTAFDPPVRVDQLPDGVWYCDMGTVHYAARSQGDGRCPKCGMSLSHKGGT